MKPSVKNNAILNIIQKTCHIIIPLIIFPYLTRTLGAENFGKYSFANSIISYFLLSAMLGVNAYAIREGARIRDDKNMLSAFISEVFTINLISGCISIIILISGTLFVSKLKQYEYLILILSIIIPATVVGRDYLNVIFEDYLYITIRYVIIQIIGICLIFSFIKDSSDYVVYTGIYAFTIASGYMANLIYTTKYVPMCITMKVNLKKHLKPILVLFCSQIATTIYIQADITMVGLLKSDFDVGVYSFVSKIYILVKGIINAVTSVAIPRIVYYLGNDNDEKYNKFSSKIFDYLFMLTVPLSVGIYILSDDTIRLLGGAEYLGGKNALGILSITLVMAVCSGFFCNAVMVPNRLEKKYLYITLAAALVNIIMNVFVIPIWGITGAAITTFFSELFVAVGSFVIGRKLLKFNASKKCMLLTVLGSLLVAAICLLVRSLIQNSLIRILITIPVSAMTYILIHVSFKSISKNDLI